MTQTIAKLVGIVALSVGTASAALAGQWTADAHIGVNPPHIFGHSPPTAVPEIDPAGALSAVTLLLGGIAVVRGRRTRK